jgi:hypothetical protein
MKAKYYIPLLLVLGVLLIGFIVIKTTTTNKKEPFTTSVYSTNTGFGYSISYNNVLLIKQDYIPSIQKNQSFCTEQDAQAVANLVLEKLYKKVNPSVSPLELKKLGIKINCIN